MKKKEVNKGKSKEEIREEIKRLSEQADQSKTLELGLFEGEVSDGFDTSKFDDTQNPKLSYRLYYTIEALLKEHLPKGDEYKKLRAYVREEKNLFLNQGKAKDEWGVRGSDSRMAYTSAILKPALDVVLHWINSGSNPFDLYIAFERLNKERGYKSEDS